jgi:HAD superfamily hydrolase (TIGR01549 family)
VTATFDGATGVVFDVDGTLVDTNYLHSLAWRRSCLDADLNVATAAIHRLIGMGSGMLMERLVGEERPDLKEGWRRHFDRLKPDIRAFDGAPELLRAVAGRGAQVVLASSSPQVDVDSALEALGVADALSVVTGADDVEEAKPAPDVFRVALERAGLEPASAIAVGDSVWDVEAARRTGLACVCLRSGGISGQELEAAGAVAVYDGPDHLLAGLDQSPLGALLGAR